MSHNDIQSSRKLASIIYRVAAIYGVVALIPLYFVPLPDPFRLTHLGFVGIALVFQGVFWIIARDPIHFRALVPITIWEKLCFGIPAMAFYLRGQTDPIVAGFGAIDLVWACVFSFAWLRLRKAA